eukprot:360243-Chlamydomonas_euryale.AAC.2
MRPTDPVSSLIQPAHQPHTSLRPHTSIPRTRTPQIRVSCVAACRVHHGQGILWGRPHRGGAAQRGGFEYELSAAVLRNEAGLGINCQMCGARAPLGSA